MLNRFRRHLDRAVELRVDPRVDAKVDARVDARIAGVIEQLERSQRDFEARLAGTQADFSYIRSEFDRIAPQLAALEHRFEALRLQLDVTGSEPDDMLSRAQLEHERARLRLELAAHYEERLRRLEED
jgi:septal ring factor EnvC (AmiA/AmiB activator)